MKILVTGGPVHAHLDSVKIITNKFKGKSIASLADELYYFGHDVDYLCSNQAYKPSHADIQIHSGFENYMSYVFHNAKDYDAVILGAAVANLIPTKPYKNKFPSHNYKEMGRFCHIDAWKEKYTRLDQCRECRS